MRTRTKHVTYLTDWLGTIVLFLFWLFALVGFLFIVVSIVRAQVFEDGIPVPNREKSFEINVCYTRDSGEVICEQTMLPELVRDFGRVTQLLGSPVDAARMLSGLPTYALARYHHWVFGFDVLPRAQRQYADCVGRYRLLQQLLGLKPLIDSPSSPLLPIVTSVREYLVPMDAIQGSDLSKPPKLIDAISHAIAAVESVNLTAVHTGLCERGVTAMRKEIKRRLRR